MLRALAVALLAVAAGAARLNKLPPRWDIAEDVSIFSSEGHRRALSAASLHTAERFSMSFRAASHGVFEVDFERINATPPDAAALSGVAEQLRDALKQQAARVIDLFREWDDDDNGIVSKKEFRKALPMLGVEAPRSRHFRLFSRSGTRSGVCVGPQHLRSGWASRQACGGPFAGEQKRHGCALRLLGP